MIVPAGFPVFSDILLVMLLSFFSDVMLPLAASSMYSGICLQYVLIFFEESL